MEPCDASFLAKEMLLKQTRGLFDFVILRWRIPFSQKLAVTRPIMAKQTHDLPEN